MSDTETPEIEETRINPGDPYRSDGTFDITKKLAWASS